MYILDLDPPLTTAATEEGSGHVGGTSTIGRTNGNNMGTLTEIYNSNYQPMALNVDWLNDQLYVAENDRVIPYFS